MNKPTQDEESEAAREHARKVFETLERSANRRERRLRDRGKGDPIDYDRERDRARHKR